MLSIPSPLSGIRSPFNRRGDFYSVLGFKPPLVLAFERNYYRANGTSTTFDSAVTHTRASSATYIDASGILQTAAINEPRTASHYWDGAAWVKGYQHESEARTNLVTYSADFTNAAWVNSATGVASAPIVTPNAAIAPDGTMAAGRVQFSLNGGTTTSDISQMLQTLSYTAANHTGSLWLRSNTGADQTIILVIENIQVATLTVTTDWQRFNGTRLTALSSSNFGLRARGTFTGDAPDILIYGAQLEAGSTPSSYIPTAGATVTRAADVLTLPIANIPYPSGSPLAVSIAMDGVMTGASSTFANWTLDANNGILVQSGASSFTFTQEAGGVVDTVTGGSYTSGVNVPFSIASRHGSTFINGAVDGVALTADLTPVAFPDLSATDMQIAPTFNGFISSFRMWGDAAGDIGDAGIAEASA